MAYKYPTDPQEIFNETARFLFEQGERAMCEGACAYLGDNGMRCAVGRHMKASEYRVGWEGKNICMLHKHYTLPARISDNLELLTKLQKVHDIPGYWDKTDFMREGLARIAADRGLDASILPTLSFKDR